MTRKKGKGKANPPGNDGKLRSASGDDGGDDDSDGLGYASAGSEGKGGGGAGRGGTGGVGNADKTAAPGPSGDSPADGGGSSSKHQDAKALHAALLQFGVASRERALGSFDRRSRAGRRSSTRRGRKSHASDSGSDSCSSSSVDSGDTSASVSFSSRSFAGRSRRHRRRTSRRSGDRRRKKGGRSQSHRRRNRKGSKSSHRRSHRRRGRKSSRSRRSRRSRRHRRGRYSDSSSSGDSDSSRGSGSDSDEERYKYMAKDGKRNIRRLGHVSFRRFLQEQFESVPVPAKNTHTRLELWTLASFFDEAAGEGLSFRLRSINMLYKRFVGILLAYKNPLPNKQPAWDLCSTLQGDRFVRLREGMISDSLYTRVLRRTARQAKLTEKALRQPTAKQQSAAQ